MPLALHFKTAGAGEPIVILHGLFGSAGNWSSVAKRLQKAYHVVSADLRNHGDSPHAKSMSYAEMAEDVLALLDRLALGKTNLIGHSLGGKVAMVCALLRPERVKRLVVVDTAPVAYSRRFDDLIQSMQALPLDQLGGRSEADHWLSHDIAEQGLRQFLLQNLRFADGHYRWRIDLKAITANMDAIIGFPPFDTSYTGETGFMRGEKSGYLCQEYLPQITRYFPNSSVATIPNAGHWPHSEQPERFMALLFQILRRNDSEEP
ncbi:MAG: alpha/beta fold hydrolase [Gammaproteobacteria bacterium]